MTQMSTGQKQARIPQILLHEAQGASRCFSLPSGPEWHLPPVLGISWHQVHPVAGNSFQDALRESKLQLGLLQGRHPVLLPHHWHNVEADLPPAAGHQQGQVQLPFLQVSSIQGTCNNLPSIQLPSSGPNPALVWDTLPAVMTALLCICSSSTCP